MPVETFPIPFKPLLEGGSLSALFQPIVDNRTGAIHGYEALIRGPSDSPLHSPHVLFAVAQREGLLVQLDRICAQTQLARRLVESLEIGLMVTLLVFLAVLGVALMVVGLAGLMTYAPVPIAALVATFVFVSGFAYRASGGGR